MSSKEIEDFAAAWNAAFEDKNYVLFTDEYLEERYPELKKLGDEYRELRKKYIMWEQLKGNKEGIE